MSSKEIKCDFSIVFNEVDRLSKEPDLSMNNKDKIEYDEIRALGEILLDIQDSPSLCYTGN